MKIALTYILLFTISIVHAQELKNTEWVKIFAERKDGSKIIGGIRRDQKVENFFFKDNSVLISINHQYSAREMYSIKDGMLSIGNFLKFKIDTVGDLVLKLTEIKESFPDNQLNTYCFIKSKYLFEFLKENNQLQIEGDSIIDCNRQFSPTSKYDLASVLRKPFQYLGDSVSLKGYFIIGHNRKISDIYVDPSSNVNQNQAEAFEAAIKKTARLWILPFTDKPYLFKMDFSCFFKSKFTTIGGHDGEFYNADIHFNDDDITLQTPPH